MDPLKRSGALQQPTCALDANAKLCDRLSTTADRPSYRGHQSSLICFIHLLRSTASSVFNLCARQSFSTISLQVFFGLSLGLAPSTSYTIHFFTQSFSSFHSTCPYHRNLFCCTTEIMSSNTSLSLNPLLGTPSCSLTSHIHLTILISAC